MGIMNLVLSDCLSAMRTVLTKAGISPDYVEKYMQEFVNELDKQTDKNDLIEMLHQLKQVLTDKIKIIENYEKSVKK